MGRRERRGCKFYSSVIHIEKGKKNMDLGKMSPGIFPHTSGREEG
jgi:hypothetical protein